MGQSGPALGQGAHADTGPIRHVAVRRRLVARKSRRSRGPRPVRLGRRARPARPERTGGPGARSARTGAGVFPQRVLRRRPRAGPRRVPGVAVRPPPRPVPAGADGRRPGDRRLPGYPAVPGRAAQADPRAGNRRYRRGGRTERVQPGGAGIGSAIRHAVGTRRLGAHRRRLDLLGVPQPLAVAGAGLSRHDSVHRRSHGQPLLGRWRRGCRSLRGRDPCRLEGVLPAAVPDGNDSGRPRPRWAAGLLGHRT